MGNCSAGLNAAFFTGLEFISKQLSREGVKMTVISFFISGKWYPVEKPFLVE